jgi:hypothetical protein
MAKNLWALFVNKITGNRARDDEINMKVRVSFAIILSLVFLIMGLNNIPSKKAMRSSRKSLKLRQRAL